MTKKTTKMSYVFTAFLILLTMCWSNSLYSQGMSINASGARADTSSLLDLSSTNKGLLLPRMSTVQRNAIVQPAIGLMIWNTNTKCVNTYLGTYWKADCGSCDFTPSTPSYAIVSNGINLSATTVSGATYFWSGPNGFTSSSQNPVIPNVTTSANAIGTYSLTTTLNGCTSLPQSIDVTYTVFTPVTTSFSYTGGQQTYTLSAGTTGIIYDMYGSRGSDYNCTAGRGGRVQGKTTVSGGTTLYLYVGGYSSNYNAGFNGGSSSSQAGSWGWGGGGGGGTDIRIGGTSYSSRIAVAGGGAGGSNGWNWGCGTGGNGGGLTGANATSSGGWYGQGGNQSSGGWGWNSNGSLGDGGSSWCGGGAGGGGYFGGGGGGWAGGGGGGSNYVRPSDTNVSHTQGGNSSYGSITITTY